MRADVVDLDFKLIDIGITRDDALDEVCIALGQRQGGGADLLLDQAAHACQQRAEIVEFGIELGGKMFAHGFLLSRSGR